MLKDFPFSPAEKDLCIARQSKSNPKGLTKEELVEFAKHYGVKSSGTKAELCDAIFAHLEHAHAHAHARARVPAHRPSGGVAKQQKQQKRQKKQISDSDFPRPPIDDISFPEVPTHLPVPKKVVTIKVPKTVRFNIKEYITKLLAVIPPTSVAKPQLIEFMTYSSFDNDEIQLVIDLCKRYKLLPMDFTF